MGSVRKQRSREERKEVFFQTHVAKLREEVCLLELGVNLQQHLMYTLIMPPKREH